MKKRFPVLAVAISMTMASHVLAQTDAPTQKEKHMIEAYDTLNYIGLDKAKSETDSFKKKSKVIYDNYLLKKIFRMDLALEKHLIIFIIQNSVKQILKVFLFSFMAATGKGKSKILMLLSAKNCLSRILT